MKLKYITSQNLMILKYLYIIRGKNYLYKRFFHVSILNLRELNENFKKTLG